MQKKKTSRVTYHTNERIDYNGTDESIVSTKDWIIGAASFQKLDSTRPETPIKKEGPRQVRFANAAEREEVLKFEGGNQKNKRKTKIDTEE